ncbi:hypothetical protein ACFSTC_20685 [Nonomuraea ferruginea]
MSSAARSAVRIAQVAVVVCATTASLAWAVVRHGRAGRDAQEGGRRGERGPVAAGPGVHQGRADAVEPQGHPPRRVLRGAGGGPGARAGRQPAGRTWRSDPWPPWSGAR